MVTCTQILVSMENGPSVLLPVAPGRKVEIKVSDDGHLRINNEIGNLMLAVRAGAWRYVQPTYSGSEPTPTE